MFDIRAVSYRRAVRVCASWRDSWELLRGRQSLSWICHARRGKAAGQQSSVQSAVCVRTEQASAHSPDILNGRAAGLCVNFAACRSAGLAARSCARRGTAVLQLSLASPPVVFSP